MYVSELMIGTSLNSYTKIENVGKELVKSPSLTDITMSSQSWTSTPSGYPDNSPVVSSNVAQLGLFKMLNTIELSSSDPVGIYVYKSSSRILAEGVSPLIIG